MTDQQNAYSGQAQNTAPGSDYNTYVFIVSQILSCISTAKLVKVIACTNAGGLAAVGFVDVQPLVAQVDGAGQTTPHGIVYGLPYARVQGGAGAFILDPVAGDIGLALICDRDSSTVKATLDAGPPGSARQYDMADGVYLGGVLNGVPTQVVQFLPAGGINITATGPVIITAPHVNLISADVNLGGTGGKKVVLDGDPVIGGGGGTVQASSTKVKAV